MVTAMGEADQVPTHWGAGATAASAGVTARAVAIKNRAVRFMLLPGLQSVAFPVAVEGPLQDNPIARGWFRLGLGTFVMAKWG